MRQVVLDTETTGLEYTQGHRIIEIGCVELIDRKLTGRHYHQYIKPNREIDSGAIEVHGITNQFLEDKPLFNQIYKDFLAFIDGAELIIHNAPFDIGFLDNELKTLGKECPGQLVDYCTFVDTLTMARQKHPGQRNNLDALCSRYAVDNSQRELHGALLDAEILADVYLLMTGGQTNLLLSSSDSYEEGGDKSNDNTTIKRINTKRSSLKVIHATKAELEAHEVRLKEIDAASDGNNRWRHQLNDKA